MGCYLSKVDDKVYITEGKGRNFEYASASCQGWRREQEDAEVCISDFDENASLFILCDGHGGAEVAKYTVAHLPNFIKNHHLYKEGKYEELLSVALIDFDAHLRTDEVMAKLEKIANDDEEKHNQANMSDSNPHSEPLVNTSAGSSNEPAGGSGSSSGSGSAGPSTSTSNGLSSVAEDVDTETLRREAQLPLDVLINKYAPVKSRVVSLNKPSEGSGNEGENKEKSGGDSTSDQPEPSSSKASAEEGPSSTSGDNPMTGLDLFKKVYMENFDDSEDDSEFEGTDESDDDEDSDEDGDDERDEETLDERSKKVFSRKHRKADKKQGESSSEDDDDDDEEDDSSEDESEEADNDDDDQDEEEDGADGDDSEDGDYVNEDLGISLPLLGNISGMRGQKRMALLSDKIKAQAKVHKPGMDSGCTVVVALVKDKKLFVASAGDSRCIMIMRDGKCQPMSFDHKPEDATEHRRILKAGGLVCEGRVNGGLNLSRALGDFTYKDPKLDAKDQMITPCPDVKVADLDPDKVEYILIACDGIWNSYDSDAVAEYIRKVAPTKKDLAEICAALFKLCLAPNCDGDGTGCDNMTCILVRYDSSNVTTSSTNNRNDLKLSSTTNNPEDGVKEESEEKQSTKRQADGETGGNSDHKRRCFHLLPSSTES